MTKMRFLICIYAAALGQWALMYFSPEFCLAAVVLIVSWAVKYGIYDDLIGDKRRLSLQNKDMPASRVPRSRIGNAQTYLSPQRKSAEGFADVRKRILKTAC